MARLATTLSAANSVRQFNSNNTVVGVVSMLLPALQSIGSVRRLMLLDVVRDLNGQTSASNVRREQIDALKLLSRDRNRILQLPDTSGHGHKL